MVDELNELRSMTLQYFERGQLIKQIHNITLQKDMDNDYKVELISIAFKDSRVDV